MTAQELKISILQLAIQGKLVPQNSSDEPASELLKHIRAEKTKLISDGKLKKEKSLPPITDEEKSFNIPDTWEWIRLGDIGSWGSGATPSKSNTAFYDKGTIPWLVTGDLNDGYITEIPGRITELALAKTSVKLNPTNSVLIAMYGATIGRVGILTFPATTNQACCACKPIAGIDLWYLMYFLMSQRNAFIKRGEGGAQPNISKEKIVVTPMPLPPLEEQVRIVKRIEELLPYIDEYDKTERHLAKLNSEFPDKLRKSILQQAVQGKLTERHPDDEPASELLKSIREAKEKLIVGGKLKKEKDLLPIEDDEKPFDIPDTWEWERIGNLFSVIRGSSPRPKGSPLYWSQKETRFNWITIKDISDHTKNGVMYKTHEHLTEAGAKLSTFVDKGELIIAVSGSTTGKFCTLGIEGYIYDGLAAVLNPTKIISNEYLNVFFSWVYQLLNSQKIGSAFPNINTDVLKNTLIPIPPLAEQKRIVARVEELLAVCDKLK